MRFPAAIDRPVAASLRALPGVAAELIADDVGAAALFERAELHGVAGVLWDAWKASGAPVAPALAKRLDVGVIARELDHEAHLGVLRRIDRHIAVPALVLKGPLFAKRYYSRPSARGTSDIDLLIAEDDVARAAASLAPLGYTIIDSDREIARARREHHHLHCVGRGLPDLELHFHAYRGFGMTLRAAMLAERSVVAPGFSVLRVAAPEDELVYLAVHAAAHRFGRLAWLHDLRLVVERLSPASLGIAADRAQAWGLGRVLALAAQLLVDVLGVSPDTVTPLGALSPARAVLVRAVVSEPRARVLGPAARFVYATSLAGSTSASLRYAAGYSYGHARRLLGVE